MAKKGVVRNVTRGWNGCMNYGATQRARSAIVLLRSLLLVEQFLPGERRQGSKKKVWVTACAGSARA